MLLHGDAAFPAQGVVAETLNLQALKGYSTGGTIHVIQNNQVGFTTDPEEARSTPYAADMAKGFNVPIVHVNADDVEACSAAVRLAMAYRERWGRDIVIDVIGYRRFGHNETDEPAYTQPAMAAKIKTHPPVSEIYAEKLIGEGTISAEDVGHASEQRREEMSAALKDLREKMEAGEYEDPTVTTTSSTGELLDRTASPPVDTAVAAEKLRALNEELLKTPDGFNVHRKLRRPLSQAGRGDRARAAIDFGQAEALAFGSLLTEGVHIRLTGQDTERGTFSHRHLVLHDENTGLEYTPMQNLEDASAPFELYNSPLSEIACLGFEYGYSAADAQARWSSGRPSSATSPTPRQVIIDSFIVSGESKWGQTSRLTLLLPHGYEGSGPEHSSARIERFLALGAEGNIRIANPTTAAQYFHLLRRQALIRKPRPLIVFTPKGLLRLDRAAATHRGPDRRRACSFILDDPTGDGAPREGRAPGPLHRQGLLRHRRQRAARGRRERRHRPGRDALPVRQGTAEGADRLLPEPEGDRLGPGGAAQHGRLEGDVAPDAGAAARGRRAHLHRPPGPGQPGRGLLRRPRARAGAHRPHRAHTRRLRRRMPALRRSRSPSRGACSSG